MDTDDQFNDPVLDRNQTTLSGYFSLAFNVVLYDSDDDVGYYDYMVTYIVLLAVLSVCIAAPLTLSVMSEGVDATVAAITAESAYSVDSIVGSVALIVASWAVFGMLAGLWKFLHGEVR